MRLAKIIFIIGIAFLSFFLGQISIAKKFQNKVLEIKTRTYNGYFIVRELVYYPSDTIPFELPIPTDTIILLVKE